MSRFGKYCLWTVMVFFAAGISSPGFAQEQEAGELTEVKRQIMILTEEIEKMKLGAVAEPKYESFMGLGPAASKVYSIDKGLSLGGYGEIIYENYQDSTKKDFGDTQRFILYAGYKFNDWIVMNTELEFEHGGIKNVSGRQPEVYIEFSYLDFLLSKGMNVRTGLMLMPIGLINEYHEPTVFNGVIRPDVERNIIPSTWRDIGIMAYGEFGKLSYNAAIVNALRADLFKKGTWIRDGRQQGAEINAEKWGGIVRVNLDISDDLGFGGSYYRSNAVHGKGKDQALPLAVNEADGNVSLWEVHAQYQVKALQLKGLYTSGSLEGNHALMALGAGKKVEGWYAEAAFDIMSLIKSGYEMSLTPFVRYESYDTHKEVFTGTRDPQQDRTVKTAGIGFKPHSNVVLKADYQWRDTESTLKAGKGTNLDENKIDQINLGIGFIF